MTHQIRIGQQGVGGDARHILHEALEGRHAGGAPYEQDLTYGLPILRLQFSRVGFPF